MRSLLVAAVGLVLLVTGIVAVALSGGPLEATDFGWFAYTPLEPESTGVPGISVTGDYLLVSRSRLVLGIVAGGVGLALLAGVIGHAVGRQARGPSDSPS